MVTLIILWHSAATLQYCSTYNCTYTQILRRTSYTVHTSTYRTSKIIINFYYLQFVQSFFCPPTKTCKRKLKLGAGGSLKVFQNLVELPLVDWGLGMIFILLCLHLIPPKMQLLWFTYQRNILLTSIWLLNKRGLHLIQTISLKKRTELQSNFFFLFLGVVQNV